MASKQITHTLVAQGGRELRVRQQANGSFLCDYFCSDTAGGTHSAPEFNLATALADPGCPLTPQEASDSIAFMLDYCDTAAGFS